MFKFLTTIENPNYYIVLNKVDLDQQYTHISSTFGPIAETARRQILCFPFSKVLRRLREILCYTCT